MRIRVFTRVHVFVCHACAFFVALVRASPKIIIIWLELPRYPGDTRPNTDSPPYSSLPRQIEEELRICQMPVWVLKVALPVLVRWPIECMRIRGWRLCTWAGEKSAVNGGEWGFDAPSRSEQDWERGFEFVSTRRILTGTTHLMLFCLLLSVVSVSLPS